MSELLRMEDVSKRYGPVRALQNVSIAFEPGRIHAVLGENGAGKSTLMGVLAGFVSPDHGAVRLGERTLPLGRAGEAKRRGIEMIHQHFTLVPEFTVAENLALARLGRLARTVRPEREAESAVRTARELGWSLDLGVKVRNLPVGAQQRLEILKALSGESRALIFDEPTAVLSPEEVVELFGVLRKLRDAGKIVVLIAHKLSEVLAVADEISVLRRGRMVGSGKRSEFDESSLAALMVGDMPERPTIDRPNESKDGLTVEDAVVSGDRGEQAVRGATLTARRGEILGIGGVDGNGQVELAEALVGVRRLDAGRILWEGRSPSYDDLNVGYVPQDRQTDGLALTMSVLDNMLVSGHRKPELRRGPLLDLGAAVRWATGLMERFSVNAESPRTRVGTLSGGNRQKIVVARALDSTPDLLVVVNPTRGLDILATEYVHETIRKARSEMAAIVLFSTDLDELYDLSDRTLFMSAGKLTQDTGAASMVGGS